MPAKDFYALLQIGRGASDEDIKRAFRTQIARYHPDKVQHLGREFQDMAASRAAELTEAYQVLSDPVRRAEYDEAAPRAGGDPPQRDATDRVAARPTVGTEAPAASPPPAGGAQFRQERAVRDEFVRQAILERFRQVVERVAGDGYERAAVRGFDAAWTPRPRLLARTRGPHLLGRFVVSVDRSAVAETWLQAARWNTSRGEDVCVILMGPSVASPRELADAIAEERRRLPRGAHVTLIPVDTSAWDAHVPSGAPGVAKALLAELRKRP